MTAGSLIILCVVLLLSCAARFVSHITTRQLLLLSCCYLFYGAWGGLPFLALLVASSVMNYFLGAMVRVLPTTGRLWVGVAFNIVLLGAFKYLPPLAEAFPAAFEGADRVRQILLPLGISFWTFQAISYLIDVYLEKDVNPTPLEFCLYMAFWPTVISGPVCRLTRMLPQFRTTSTTVAEDWTVGLVRCTQGLFMKLVLAQLLAAGLTSGAGVVAGFDEVGAGWNGLDVWALAVGYAFLLFFDFAGYSNIVIGVGRLFGFRLQENFDRPYLSTSPSVFWSRWHMSLSLWIRDYVYTPLSTLRREKWWPYPALFLSMVIFGFWHAAKMTYVVWGAYHGAVLVAHRIGQRVNQHIPFTLPAPVVALLSWATTFVLVLVGYVLFRANSVTQAFEMLQAAGRFDTYSFADTILPREFYVLVLFMSVGYFVYEGLAHLQRMWTTSYRNTLRARVTSSPSLSGWGMLGRAVLAAEGSVAERRWWWSAPALVLLLLMTSMTFLGQSGNIAPFIYLLF